MFHPHSPSVRRDFGRDAKFTKFQTGRTYEDGSFLSVERKRSTFVKKQELMRNDAIVMAAMEKQIWMENREKDLILKQIGDLKAARDARKRKRSRAARAALVKRCHELAAAVQKCWRNCKVRSEAAALLQYYREKRAAERMQVFLMKRLRGLQARRDYRRKKTAVAVAYRVVRSFLLVRRFRRAALQALARHRVAAALVGGGLAGAVADCSSRERCAIPIQNRWRGLAALRHVRRVRGALAERRQRRRAEAAIYRVVRRHLVHRRVRWMALRKSKLIGLRRFRALRRCRMRDTWLELAADLAIEKAGDALAAARKAHWAVAHMKNLIQHDAERQRRLRHVDAGRSGGKRREKRAQRAGRALGDRVEEHVTPEERDRRDAEKAIELAKRHELTLKRAAEAKVEAADARREAKIGELKAQIRRKSLAALSAKEDEEHERQRALLKAKATVAKHEDRPKPWVAGGAVRRVHRLTDDVVPVPAMTEHQFAYMPSLRRSSTRLQAAVRWGRVASLSPSSFAGSRALAVSSPSNRAGQARGTLAALTLGKRLAAKKRAAEEDEVV
ncbi:hypothetical protein JL721_2582 [Aureococcus anophagefferens]|nr:hypothetical protein JL721_2582 [Aureococcus anophagefferens]